MVVSKEFTLKYMDGREEHYENYRYYERLTGNEKITRKGNRLYKDGNTFLKKGEDYWVEITKGQRLGTEFTLEFTDGSTEDFVGYGHYARLNGENKITRSKGRLYYHGKVFEEVVRDYWVETGKVRNRKKNNKGTNSEITIRYKSGKKQILNRNDPTVEFAGDGNWVIYGNNIFEKNKQNEWVEKDLPSKKSPSYTTKNDATIVEYKNGRKRGKACKFKLLFMNGKVKEFENYKKCDRDGKIKLSSGNKVLFYDGYRFTRDPQDRHTWLQDPEYFNKFVDKFYLIKDTNVWEFENMQSHFDRQDREHMQLNDEIMRASYNKKPVYISRSITFGMTKYYNVDNWRTWVAETPKKPKKEKLNHGNKIPITKFYKEGVWYFTPDKKTRNYRHFLKSNEIYVFSNKYAFWSGALWEKDPKDNVWYYRKEMLKADKVKNFIIPIKEDESFFKAEIRHLRKIGYKVNYRYIKSKRQQPNKRNEEQREEFMKKVKKMSRADRKKALNKKKKRQGKYRERRGL